MGDLQCVVVTPEKTELDVTADSVTLPLYDGEMGILKGHSPMVGRLGYGLLKIGSTADQKQYFVEGGFVQVASNVVSVLTDRMLELSQITVENAEAAMQEAIEIPTDQPDLASTREKAMVRARAMKRLAVR